MEHDASQFGPNLIGSIPSTETGEGAREKSLEELEELLRRVREDKRRLDESWPVPAQLLSQQTISTDEAPVTDQPQWKSLEQDRTGGNWPLTVPESHKPISTSAEDSEQSPGPVPSNSTAAIDTSAEQTMKIEESHPPTKPYYGFVSSSILRGFGDDDESLWLVDDEETDSEGILTPLSESVDDLQKTLQPEQHPEQSTKPNLVNRPSLEDLLVPVQQTAKPKYINRPSLEDLLGAVQQTAKPKSKREDEVRHRLHRLRQNHLGRDIPREPCHPSTSRFQYQQVPGLLDDSEWQRKPIQAAYEAPPAYEALEASSGLQGLPDYSNMLEEPNNNVQDMGDGHGDRSQQELERATDTSNTADPWRHWGPLKREDGVVEGSRSDENNGDYLGASREDVSTSTSVPSTSSKVSKMAGPRGLDSFGMSYQKANDDDNITVSRKRHHSTGFPKSQECVVCAETLDRAMFPHSSPSADCTHTPRACKQCLSTSIRMQLDDEACTRISCLECGMELDYVDVESLADKATFKRYKELVSKKSWPK